MPVSGAVPRFETGAASKDISPTVVSVAGAVSGAATGSFSTEPLPDFYRRMLGVLTISGTIGVDPAGLQCFPASAVSGIRNLHQELALRITDTELGGDYSPASRLAHANAILTASGEVQFGS